MISFKSEIPFIREARIKGIAISFRELIKIVPKGFIQSDIKSFPNSKLDIIKPKRTPNAKKSHAVLAKEGSNVKLIRFGQQGVSGAGKNPQTAKEKARRRSFKARHAKNIRRGKMSAAYWADKVKW